MPVVPHMHNMAVVVARLGGGHGGYEPKPPSKVTGTSKPIKCQAGGAGCMKQK